MKALLGRGRIFPIVHPMLNIMIPSFRHRAKGHDDVDGKDSVVGPDSKKHGSPFSNFGSRTSSSQYHYEWAEDIAQ